MRILLCKACTGVDKNSGLVHMEKINIHGISQASSLLTGEEESVNGNSGYYGAGKREEVVKNKAGRQLKYKTNRCFSQIEQMSKSGQ